MSRNSRRGKPSPLDLAYAERGLMRPSQALRTLGASIDFLGHLVNQHKLDEVRFELNERSYRGYPEGRVREIAERLTAGVPRARL